MEVGAPITIINHRKPAYRQAGIGGEKDG